MKLSVGCNWDPGIIEELKGSTEVTDFHGFLPRTVVGAGSASWPLPETSREQVAAFVVAARRAARTVTVVLDAHTMEGYEWEPPVHRRVLELFGELEGLGVSAVELSAGYLIELVRARFPRLQVKASGLARCATVDTATFLAEMGCSMVAVDPLSQRSFPVVKALARDAEVPVQVEVTCGMLRGSPSYGNMDQAWTCAALSSDREMPSVRRELSRWYNPAHDDTYKLMHPVELVAAPFVRPEDVARYEALGVEQLKLDTAFLATAEAVRRVRAYVRRGYDGNLTRLVNLLAFGQSLPRGALLVAGMTKPAEFPAEAWEAVALLSDAAGADRMVQVDNPALEGYLDHVADGKCQEFDCRECAAFVRRAVHIDEQLRERWCGVLRTFRNALVA